MLKILLPDSERDTDHLAQMHHLRYKRFVMQFGWNQGLQAINQMEFDRYDFSNPIYLANIGESNRVDTVVRLIHSTKPNYTFDEFAENARMTEKERAPDIIELSCTCGDQKTAPPNSLAILINGLIELGLASNFRHYLSTVNQRVQSISDKMKWTSDEISDRIQMDEQSFVVLKYPVTQKMHENFRALHGFSEPLLTSEEIERCQMKQRILVM